MVRESDLPEGFLEDKGDHLIITGPEGTPHKLFFALSRSRAKHSTRYWRNPSEVNPLSARHPLAGVKIALDPGHIGGAWASREGRLFIAPCGTRVAEGEMTLEVAKVLKDLLESAGARVWLTRTTASPVLNRLKKMTTTVQKTTSSHTSTTPLDETDSAETNGELRIDGDNISELEARAEMVNTIIKPDFAVCLHFNADPWGSRGAPRYSNNNHMHILVPGSYLKEELGSHEQRYDLLRRILEGTMVAELPLARRVADYLARETRLPPFSYGQNSRIAKGDDLSPYVWKRNLVVTRKFHCPVIYPEPFVMNNLSVVKKIAAAENSQWCRVSNSSDIYGKYARGVFRGILAHWAGRSHIRNEVPQPSRAQSKYAPRWLE
jgi:N-acetylmuramoyl-L-alanine amidase